SQSRLLLRGSLDWARGILREDALRSSVDALTEAWAQPLAETRLDQLGETSMLASQASISGGIEDAQSRLNLRTLVGADGKIVQRELLVLQRLAQMLGLPEQMANLIAVRVQMSLAPAPIDTGRSEPLRGTDPNAPPIGLFLPQDLAGIPGIDHDAA